MNWSLQVLDRAFRSRPVIASIALAVAAAGCTTVPTKEFASYGMHSRRRVLPARKFCWTTVPRRTG